MYNWIMSYSLWSLLITYACVHILIDIGVCFLSLLALGCGWCPDFPFPSLLMLCYLFGVFLPSPLYKWIMSGLGWWLVTLVALSQPLLLLNPYCLLCCVCPSCLFVYVMPSICALFTIFAFCTHFYLLLTPSILLYMPFFDRWWCLLLSPMVYLFQVIWPWAMASDLSPP